MSECGRGTVKEGVREEVGHKYDPETKLPEILSFKSIDQYTNKKYLDISINTLLQYIGYQIYCQYKLSIHK